MSEQEKIQTADDRPQMANPIPEDDGMAEGHGISIPEACRELGDEAEFVHPADLADHLENLSLEKQVCALRHMPTEDAAEALAELEGSVAVDVLENLDADVAAQIIAEMEPDDAADVLDELDEEHRDVLLGKLTREDSEELRNLLNFDPDSAAGVMNTELILLEENMTADEAITHIRSEMEDKESPYYAYVVDKNDKLVGVLSLRDLMLARPGTIVGDAVSGQSVVSVPYDMDKGEVANLLSHYNYLAMPVVDYEGHIMGVVTYDDIMDIMHEEASADMLGMWAPTRRKRGHPLEGKRAQAPALAGGEHGQFGALGIGGLHVRGLHRPDGRPGRAHAHGGQPAGNTGQQALAVMIRQLATDRFETKKAWMAVLREAKIGLVTGLFMAMLALCGAWGFTGNPLVGMVMAGALLCDMMLGAVAGGSIPLIFRALGRDPAQASSIFLTTITDGAGFFIFLGLATMFLF